MNLTITKLTTLLLLSGLLLSGEASAATIFRDTFTRQDSQVLGCAEIGGCWVEQNERFTVGITPDGSQTMQPADILLQNGALTYHYPGSGGYSAQPYAYAPMSWGAFSGTLSFTLKPNGASRISHEVGLMTGAGGFFADSPAVLRSHPVNSLAIGFGTTCPTYGSSCIFIIKSDNGVQSQILQTPLNVVVTPFYIGPGGSYDVTLTVANDTVTVTITDGSQTVTASAPLNGFMILFDQVYVIDEQSLVQSNGLSFDNFLVTTSEARSVTIDIKPGSFPNAINRSSNGVVPVAILSDATFDATQVDPASVALAGATVKLIGKGTKYSCSAQDVNADGRWDLVCHIQTDQLQLQDGDSSAVLEARTFAGEVIRGTDSIKIVP